MRFRVLCVVAGAVVSLYAAGTSVRATTPPNGGLDSEPDAYDVRAPFWAEASAACTDVLNNHLDRQGGAVDVFFEVLVADGDGEEPSSDTIAGWTETLAADVGRSEAIRVELAEFVVDDPAYADLWQAVVSGADDGVEVHRTRLAALETGDWGQIVAAFESTTGEGGGLNDDAFATIDASPLGGTDCVAVHSWRMPEDESVTPEFVSAVTDVCATVANRRRASGFSTDSDTSLNFLATVHDAEPTDQVAVPDDLVAALGRIVDEWELTVADFAAIDPSLAPSPESWADVIAVPAERLTMFEARRDAAASGETAAILEAYDRANFGDHPSWDWPLVGVDQRICNSLQH